jgi:hypothetical protein
MEPTIWYAVLQDESIKIYENLEPSIPCLFWVSKSDTGKTYTTIFGNTYEIYKYDILDRNGHKFELGRKGWKLIEIKDSSMKNSFEATYIKIGDPWGKPRQIPFPLCDTPPAVDAMNLLFEMHLYDSWETYDLSMKIENLEKVVKSLKNEIKSMKKSIGKSDKNDGN